MANTAVLDKEDLRSTVAEVLDVDLEDVGDETLFIDELEVDSLMALEVMVVLEKKYQVKLAEEELKEITCLRRAYELLSGKLAVA
jgi:acyl carrier protein